MTDKSDENFDLRSLDYIRSIPEINEHLEIVDKKGEGTFASVFIVRNKGCSEHMEKFALKLIIPTVDVKRIENEIRVLHRIGGHDNVIEMYSSMRIRDHIFILMPYVHHTSFSDYFWKMKEAEIQVYIRNLLTALRHVHKFGIIHRDVKPNNFLYDRRKQQFALVDFGLAHSEIHGDLGPWWGRESDSLIKSRSNLKRSLGSGVDNISPGSSAKRTRPPSTPASALGGVTSPPPCRCGSSRLTVCQGCRNRAKPTARRGGTLGYRAPEVMMREAVQTCALDIWSVGVILLAFLTGRHPFIKAEDDLDVMHAMTHLCGFEQMYEAARALNKKFLVDPKPPPCNIAYHLWLKQRCEYIRSRECNLDNVLGREYQFTEDAYHLLAGILQPNPRTRLTADHALREPFLASAPPFHTIMAESDSADISGTSKVVRRASVEPLVT